MCLGGTISGIFGFIFVAQITPKKNNFSNTGRTGEFPVKITARKTKKKI